MSTNQTRKCQKERHSTLESERMTSGERRTCKWLQGDPEINPHIGGQLTRVPRACNGKRTVFSKNCCDNWRATSQRMKLDSFLTLRTKINYKWIIELNVGAKTIKLIEENTGVNLCDLGLGNNFDTAPKEQ